MNDAVFLRRVVLRNYKSIAACSVSLGPLNFLVGPNGAGKSNFLDALRLVADALNTSLEHALRDRGGINEVRRRSSGRPRHFGIRMEFRMLNGQMGWYAFRVRALKQGGFEVQQEECRVLGPELTGDQFFEVQPGQKVRSNVTIMPPVSSDRLYLVAAAGLPQFRPAFDAFSHMGFYNLNPDVIRDLQPPDAGEVLRRDGSNLASVLALMEKESPAVRQRVVEFLSNVVPGITDIAAKHLGKKETLEFRQCVGASEDTWSFLAENMSDGTLRALGVLTALFQGTTENGKRIRLVGIEEPETAVHPGTAGVLRDALRAASASTQVLVTSHSPDLLDDKEIKDDWILGVVSEGGETKIGPIDEADRSVLRDRLFTAGDLLRQGQLTPDPQALMQTPAHQLELFGNLPE